MRPTFSVLVITHNRAEILRETLPSLVRMTSRTPWEVVVVDNNSDDHTHSVVSDVARVAPIRVRYVQERRPGKYWALNTGIQGAAGDFIACTDDDAFPRPDWLDRAADGFTRFRCDFVGGPVYPLWRRSPPSWLDKECAVYQKVLGLQDHGPQALEYGGRISWPLGVNVAYRRRVFDSVGWFDGRLGRVAGTLRNQAQREWHLRARAAGARGFYLSEMVVDHIVAADRLHKQYFRRWFYWHGISRALLCRHSSLDVEEPDSGVTHSGERRLLGLPLSLYPKALRSARSLVWHSIRRDASAFEYELWLCFFAGLLRESLTHRGHAAAEPAAACATNTAGSM
jgi:glucosyl-dolichyl phosphate glucuronosyltransferase